jgi:sugar transferase (PEP-CTERM/EpsH1 system associated)
LTETIAHVIYRLGVGGLENGLVNLINHMPEDRYRHVIICLTDSTDFKQRLHRDNVRVVELHKKPGQDWLSFWRFYQVLKQHGVTLVHTRNLAALEYQIPAFLAGIKHRVHSEHGWDVFDPDGTNKKYQWLRRFLSPLVQVFIPLSKHLQDYLQYKVNIPSKKITRICNGVDAQKFYPGQSKNISECAFLNESDKLIIGTVGRMHGVKDQMTLAQAFVSLMQMKPEYLDFVRLVMIGDGPLHEQAMQYLDQAQLSHCVWLPGERKDIADLMRAMDIFVLPSIAEGISNTILEAMATGLPIVATRVGGNPELVESGENGILVHPKAPDTMAKGLDTLIADTEQRKRMGLASRRRVEQQFSIDVMVANYLAVYDGLTQTNK